MPFPLALLYYMIIAPACVISEWVGGKLQSFIWWQIVHGLIYTYFIALPLWLVFDVSLLYTYAVYVVLEVLIVGANWYTNKSMHQ